MYLIKKLPFVSISDDQRLQVATWQMDPEEHYCEFAEGQLGACDTSGIGYGTTNELEPMFCARHFYQNVVGDDETSNYSLIDEDDESVNRNDAKR